MQILNAPKRLKRYINENHLDEILPKATLDACELCMYNRDEPVLIANTQMPYFYFFVSGKLKIFQIHENGKAFLIQFYSEFDTLGEIELLNGIEATCSVNAVNSSELIRIPMETLKNQVMDYAPFLRQISRSLAKKLLVADRHHSSNLLYPVKNRLASYLRAHVNEQNEVVLKESLQDVSEYIGTTYRQLHRAFQQLEKAGIITKEHKTIKICNLVKLEQIAGNIYS